MLVLPESFQVSQSCGRQTAAVRAAFSGSWSRSQRSLVTVNDATGTSPTASTQGCGPPSSSIRSRAACAERVSFHSSAGRTTSPSSSRQTMPCCWPPTAIAATSSRPPASASAVDSASSHAAGSTSVPGGWGARPDRTSSPVSASRTTTLHAWVDESTPATRVRAVMSAGAEQVLQGQLREADGADAAVAGGHGIEVLERRAVAQQVLVGLALGQGRLRGLGHARLGQGLLHLGVGAEGQRPLLEQQVAAHVGRRGIPDAPDLLGAQRLVVEVPRALVARAARREAVLQQVDGGERGQQVAVAEDEVLVVPRPFLAVEVEVEQLALPQRLGDAVRVVQAGHLLVPDLGVEADEVGVLEGGDEPEGVADGRQEDVAARLVRLGLQRQAQAVAAVDGVLGEGVDGLAVA